MATAIDGAVAKLRNLLGDRLSTGSSVRELHARDEAYTTPALPDAVAFPECAEEVAAIARICAGAGCPIVPYGIGTSLEGHVVPVNGGVSVDFSRMNRILEIDERNLLATVDPGRDTRTAERGIARHRADVHRRSGRERHDWRDDGDPRLGHQCRALRHDARECHGTRGGAA